MLGLPDYSRKDLAASKEEGFHLVEHILLRPDKLYEPEDAFLRLIKEESDENVVYPMPPDPYSFQLSFVFPDWPERFRNEGFKNLIHDVLISEVPAHITFYIIWLNQRQMASFESCYHQWLQSMANNAPDLRYTADRILRWLHIGIPLVAPDVTARGDYSDPYHPTE